MTLSPTMQIIFSEAKFTFDTDADTHKTGSRYFAYHFQAFRSTAHNVRQHLVCLPFSIHFSKNPNRKKKTVKLFNHFLHFRLVANNLQYTVFVRRQTDSKRVFIHTKRVNFAKRKAAIVNVL